MKNKLKKEQYLEELVEEVQNDFITRQKLKASYERQWELNLNFLRGNQYCYIDGRGELVNEDKTFFWQGRGVYNHIAPIIETRLARFSRIKPVLAVRPISDDDEDVSNSYLAEKLIEGAFNRIGIESIVNQVTSWSETCGTAFYKVVWDNFGGNKVGSVNGENVYEGEVEVLAVSPFEIFPDNFYAEKLEDCKSIIQAKAVPISVIREKYGVSVDGEEIDVFDLNPKSLSNSKREKRTISNSAIVIERYELPDETMPNGRIVTVAGGKLLYIGELPYINEKDGVRGYPFIKQDCNKSVGRFFGSSIIERLIPVQRAYNAVKNRKHEFLNRLSMGVMTVEDGSIDTDELKDEGLCPGKVLVYRQGSKAPEIMNETVLPPELSVEEERLLNEFVIVSGVSDVSSSSKNAKLSSGSALELLISQDNERMVMNAETIRNSYKNIAFKILKLYAQFTSGVRAVKYQDAFDNTKVCYADKKVALSDDVYLSSENELLYTKNQKRDIIMQIYDSGLLADENGEISASVKEKVLNLLGYKDLDNKKGITRLHEEKAKRENEVIRNKGMNIEEIDDDKIHTDEHTRYILSEYDELSEQEKDRLFAHLKQHKDRIATKNNVDKI